jgi:ankyrin repeat protein
MPPSKKSRDRSRQVGQDAERLCQAAEAGDTAAVARLLAAGADPNASMAALNEVGQVVQATALCVVAGRGRLEDARLLLDAGADPSLAAANGGTPLMCAAQTGQLAAVRLLLARGAAVDAVRPGNDGTAFHTACYTNQAECAEALARAGCDVGMKDSSGKTGREVAAALGHASVVARLRAVVSEQLRVAQTAAGSSR